MESKKENESCPCAEIEKKIENIDKTVEEEKDVRDRKDEAEDIIVASITNKIDKVEQKLEKLHHDQVNNSVFCFVIVNMSIYI